MLFAAVSLLPSRLTDCWSNRLAQHVSQQYHQIAPIFHLVGLSHPGRQSSEMPVVVWLTVSCWVFFFIILIKFQSVCG